MEKESKRDRPLAAGTGADNESEEGSVKRARVQVAKDGKEKENYLQVDDLLRHIENVGGAISSGTNLIRISEQEEKTLSRITSGNEEQDLDLMRSKHRIFAAQLNSQSKQIEDLAKNADMGLELLTQLQFCGHQAMRALIYAQEDLGLSLLLSGARVEMVDDKDESELIFDAVLRGMPEGVSHLNRLLESATSHVQWISQTVAQVSSSAGLDASVGRTEVETMRGKNIILLSKANLAETRSSLKSRLAAHASEVTACMRNAEQTELQIQSLQEEYDAACVDLSVKRRQLTARNMRLRQVEEESIALRHKQEAEDARVRDVSASVGRGEEGIQMTSERDEVSQESADAKELVAIANTPSEELACQAEKALAAIDEQKAELERDIKSLAQVLSGGLRREMVGSTRSWYASIISSPSFKISSDLLNETVTEGSVLSDQVQDLKLGDIGSLCSLFASFPEVRTEKSHGSKYSSVLAKIKKALEATEGAKRKRDRMSLKYENVKLDGGRQIISDFLTREAKLLGRIKGQVDTRLSFLKDHTKKLEFADLLPTAAFADTERKRNDETIDDIEALSVAYNDLESLYKKVRTTVSAKEETVAKTLSDLLSQKVLAREAAYELESQVVKFQVEVQRAQVLRNQLERERKQLELSREVRASSVSAALEMLHQLLGAQSELERTVAVCEVLQCKVMEVRKLREGLLARVSRAQEDVAAERQSLNALKSKLEEAMRSAKSEQQIADRLAGRIAIVDDDAPTHGVLNPEERDHQISELRKKLKCSINADQDKEVVIMRCGHLFSRRCVNDLIVNRNRKCPACHEKFGQDDVRPIHLE